MSKLHPFLLKNNIGLDLLSAKYVSINVEGGSESDCKPMGLDNVHHTKGHVANSKLQPYGLGCQLLGLC